MYFSFACSLGSSLSCLFFLLTFVFFTDRPFSHQCPEPDLRSTASQDAIDNEDNPFLKVIQAKASVLEDLNIIEVIDPLVDELDRIIEQTVNSPVVYKDLPASGSSRLDYVKFPRRLCNKNSLAIAVK